VVKVVLPPSVSYFLGSPYLHTHLESRSCGCSGPSNAPPRPTVIGRALNVHPPVARPPRPARRRSSRRVLIAPIAMRSRPVVAAPAAPSHVHCHRDGHPAAPAHIGAPPPARHTPRTVYPILLDTWEPLFL